MFKTNLSVTDSVSDRDWSPARVLSGCLLFLLILWTLLGNFTVCAAVLCYRHLRAKVTNIFIVSLALSDLLVAALVMPWKAVTEVAGHWPFGTFCDIWVAFDIMCSTTSILNLCVISVDRYWAISSPFTYERKMNKKVAFVMVSMTWTVSVVISFIPIQLNWHREDLGALVYRNSSTMENCDSSLSRAYAISSSLISFYIPVAIMLVTYTRIYRIAQAQIRKISSLERAAEHAENCRVGAFECHLHRELSAPIRKETKLLKTLAVIIGVFVCCWLPFFVLNCAVPFCQRPGSNRPVCVSETTFDVFVWLGWCNSSLNPIIYACNVDFRDAFARLLGCSGICVIRPVGIHRNEHASNNQDSSVNTLIGVAYTSIPAEVDEVDEETNSQPEGPHEPLRESLTEPLCNVEECGDE
ncbi:D(1) dopamine receptor [Chanos chanos]|uniref:D(1B) dopamine receptor n=1 Tax=Chanos chanos TaxID=29144 RepID=A0A6J2WHF3_CHACN|nr:D(1) dopamine receptor-like [Chanos chanos]